MLAIGVYSISIIIFTGFFTGMVLGLQGYHLLKSFSSEAMLGSGVAKSLISELGPVLSAILLTGRAGSAICAQIGVMRISEQVDALECMAVDIFNFLISPKLLAGLISLPILTMLFCVTGIFGGWVTGVGMLGVNNAYFYDGMVSAITTTDVKMCLIKSLVFALLVISICSYKGYRVLKQKEKGARAVSSATTQAVVSSSVWILIVDYLLTSVLL